MQTCLEKICCCHTRARPLAGQGCVLGLATGSTPRDVYKELVRMHREEGLSFAHVTTFNLDEYWPIQPGSLQVLSAAPRSSIALQAQLGNSCIAIPCKYLTGRGLAVVSAVLGPHPLLASLGGPLHACSVMGEAALRWPVHRSKLACCCTTVQPQAALKPVPLLIAELPPIHA